MAYDLDSVIKLIVLRYALIPKQLLAFEYGYSKDAKEFDDWFVAGASEVARAIRTFLTFLEERKVSTTYSDKTNAIIAFSETLPFMALQFSSLEFDPFEDFLSEEVDEYLDGKHVPKFFDPEIDDCSIFYVENPEYYYAWYNEIPDKSLKNLLTMYADLLICT